MTSLGISYPPRQPRPSARPVLTLAGIPLKGRLSELQPDRSRPGWDPRRADGRRRVWAQPWGHAFACCCLPEETFTCRRCGRRFGWCLGDYDIMPTACKFCCGPGEAR